MLRKLQQWLLQRQQLGSLFFAEAVPGPAQNIMLSEVAQTYLQPCGRLRPCAACLHPLSKQLRDYLPHVWSPQLALWQNLRIARLPAVWHQPTSWMLGEWALAVKPRPHLRTIMNALYTAGWQVQRLMPLLIAQAVLGRSAHAYYGPHGVGLMDAPLRRHRQPAWLQQLAHQLYEACSNVARTLTLAAIFAPALLTMPFALYLGWWRERWMHLLRQTLEAAGPAFMKWGQWAATRADMFPPDMCRALEGLQTRAPAHSLRHTREAILRALGAPAEELFDDFEAQPLASGSIGQVHRARLSVRGAQSTGIQPGTLVAVKVRHPGVSGSIARDFQLMLVGARLAAWLPSLAALRLEESLEQFAAPLQEQVDLAREARHLWQFNFNFRKRRGVRFPFPIYPLVEAEVLVETFEAGASISRYIAAPGNRFNTQLAQLGSSAMLHMMLVDSFIHSDLHPGNILVALDPPPRPLLSLAAEALQSSGLRVPPSWQRPCIVLLDVGMATHLSEEDQSNMLALFKAFSSMDGRGIASAVLAFSGQHQSCPDRERFAQQMNEQMQAISHAETWGTSEACGSGAQALSSVLELVRQNQVSLPGHICAVVMTTLVLEGWSSALDPQHSVLEQVDKVLALTDRSWGRRMATAVDSVLDSSASLAL